MRTTLLLLAASLPALASADEIFLKSGGQLSGRIVSRSATEIAVDIGAGRITVPVSAVARIQEGRSALHEYEDRAAQLAPGDVGAWVALGDWASARGLGTQATQAYERALAAQPDNARANEALGRVQLGGRWVSEDESYKAKGYVRYQGDWITPAEHEAIMREQSLEDQRNRAQREADTREAEARAREAEARAKQAEAEAQAQQASEGIPLWYAWGPGPVQWSTGYNVPSLSRQNWKVR